MRGLHVAGAWVVMIGNGAVGVWALLAHRWPRFRRPALWWATAAAEVAVVVQAALGVALMEVDGVEAESFHTFYGFIAIVAVAILYSYRQQLRGQLHLLYGFGSLFVMGLAIRAHTLPA